MVEVLLLSALVLAFVNGANDNLKGVATLYGADSLSYRGALWMATGTTFAGSLASIFLATGLVKAFSGKGLVPVASLTPEFLAAVGAGAALTVLLATRIGMPISTTHALVGGLTGAGLIAAGSDLELAALGSSFAVPLLVGPLLAVAAAWAFFHGGRRAGARAGLSLDHCVCIDGAWPPLAVTQPASALHATATRMTVGRSDVCEDRGEVARIGVASVVRAAHLVSAGAVGFARGLNDTPKILGLLLGAAILEPVTGALAIAFMMALGGIMAARQVGETLAKRITPLSEGQGLAANLAASLLVIGASRIGIPVSTTHVATGGIFGVGAVGGTLSRRTTRDILGSWMLTLPIAAAFSASLAWAFGAG